MHTVAADLHMHTVASDGTCTIKDRVVQAREKDLDAIAITDHDTIPDAVTQPVEHRNGVELVAGCELRAGVDGTKVEILGYYVDPGNETLREVCDRANQYRIDRNKAIIDKVNEKTSVSLSYEDLVEAVRMLTRPHIAETLVENGVVPDFQSAFDEYLAPGGSCFVPMEKISIETAVDAIHAAGGVASVAHPGKIRAENIRDVLQQAVDDGVDGIEVWYPYDGSFDPGHDWVEAAHDLAEIHGLVKTGGSDCHGPNSHKYRIGECGMTATAFAQLEEYADR